MVWFGTSGFAQVQNSQPEKAPLPQIQLEDYTIIGLEKVVLPKKERRTLFRKTELNWTENASIREKPSPDISFRSSNKPGLLFVTGSPYVDALLEYGSFNTMSARIDAKYVGENLIPFVGVDFHKSDGHVTNADYTRAVISSGIEGHAWGGSVIQLVGGYSKDEQSLWSSAIPSDSSMKKKLTAWNWQAGLSQKLSEQFSIFTTGQFQESDLQNRFKYTQNWLSIGAGGIFSSSKASILIEGDMMRYKTKRDVDGVNPFLSALSWETEHSLYSNKASAAYKAGNIYLSAGIRAQHLKVEASSKTNFYPIAEFRFNAQSETQFVVRYQPGLLFQSMGQMLEAHEIADFGSFQPLKAKNKVVGVFYLNASRNLHFSISSDYSEFENLPVVYSSYVDTSTAGSAPLNYVYPYWEYRYINDARIWENSLRAVLRLPQRFLVEGWMTYRWNEIATNDEGGNPVTGKEIPYLSVVSLQTRIEWYFLGNHKFEITGEYSGERFNDVANSTTLKNYFLVGAMINFELTNQISLRFFGKNLLDQSYELYRTYSAPGISGGGGIGIKL